MFCITSMHDDQSVRHMPLHMGSGSSTCCCTSAWASDSVHMHHKRCPLSCLVCVCQCCLLSFVLGFQADVCHAFFASTVNESLKQQADKACLPPTVPTGVLLVRRHSTMQLPSCDTFVEGIRSRCHACQFIPVPCIVTSQPPLCIGQEKQAVADV